MKFSFCFKVLIILWGVFAASEALGRYRADAALYDEFMRQVETNTDVNADVPVTDQDSAYISYEARQAYQDHIYYDGRQLDYFTDDALTHFLETNLRWEARESTIHCPPGNPHCQEKYGARYDHVVGCHICNGFYQRFFHDSSVELPPFYPPYAIYDHQVLKTYLGHVLWRGVMRPIYYDQYAHRWAFEYSGGIYWLSF